MEVALLTRNFVVVAESDAGDVTKGWHFNIAHTPGQVQSIVGVEFVNMGRKGEVDRYVRNEIVVFPFPWDFLSLL